MGCSDSQFSAEYANLSNDIYTSSLPPWMRNINKQKVKVKQESELELEQLQTHLPKLNFDVKEFSENNNQLDIPVASSRSVIWNPYKNSPKYADTKTVVMIDKELFNIRESENEEQMVM